MGKRGTYFNAGIPGTGLSTRSLIAPAAPRPSPTTTTRVSGTCSVEEDGRLRFVDGDGKPLPDQWVEVAKKQQRDALMGLIHRACDEVNAEVEDLGRLHLATPRPDVRPAFVGSPFDEAAPSAPSTKPVGFMARLFASKRRAIEQANSEAQARYRRALDEWTARKDAHEREQQQRRELIEHGILADTEAMESFLEERLCGIEWPRETSVAFEVREGGRLVALDVDLPEIENMPSKVAAVPARGLRLSVKDMPAAKVQRLYLNHVHGILFRLIGETFAALPLVQTVTASGYSQRANSATGRVEDDYLLSVRNIQRSGKLLAVQPLNG